MVRPALLLALAWSAMADAKVSFNREIRPILSEQCFSCHGFDAKHRKADLRLDTREGALAENDGVRAIIPGDPAKSELWKRLLSQDPEEVMPPPEAHKPKLTAKQRETLRRWIEEGAPYEPHWAFTPPQRPDLKEEGPAAIDALIDNGLKEAGLKASAEASPEKLLRRLSLDLTGLPPTPAELDAFLQARAKDPQAAYVTAIDRLLASPAYGERWGRWWLDQARYADSNGYSIDAPRSIWKYRDWVVSSLNADLPFDRFTVEQLAGDLLPDAGEAQRIATGFHRNTPLNQEGGIDVEQFRIDSVIDRVGTTGTVWLGLTVGCAQCHDHKFDPITQKEFYRMFAFFNNQEEPMMKVSDPSRDEAKLTAAVRDADQALATFLDQRGPALQQWETTLTKAETAKLSGPAKAALRKPAAKRNVTERALLFAASPGATDKTFKALQKKAKDAADLRDGAPTTLVLKELAKPRKTHLLTAGDFTRPAEEVAPGVLATLHAFKPDQGSVDRLDLARWIVSKDNPVTARVIANRVWQAYFGRGLVETDNDFGSQGTSPSHPELLDWLAVELVERGWSLKSLHRTIVLTRTYRRDSASRPDLIEKDPDNRLLARQTRLRLDAELVRDSALVASGLLNHKVGPPVYPPIPDGVMSLGQVKRAWNTSKGEDRTRRGLYTFTYRVTPPPAFAVFDAPDGLSTCTRRNRSNTPLQALTLLNDPAYFEAAQALAKVIEKEGLATAFRRCTSRAPEAAELAVLSPLDRLSAARALLNLDETITRD